MSHQRNIYYIGESRQGWAAVRVGPPLYSAHDTSATNVRAWHYFSRW